ncbi:MAG TPA: c-type cytochrome [Anaerolineales bacterium]|nr:c-type cytochrome [Anaerolineales bacterium]
MKWQVALGGLSLAVLTVVLGWIALNESNRMAGADRAYQAQAIETGALEFETLCRTCHGPQGKGTPLAPALNAADLFNGSRLQAVSFPGTVEDYVRSTISSGRPVPSAGTNYPNRMPTWSSRFGGPLRDDQIDALVAFIMNWQDRALAEAAATPALPPGSTVGTDITQALPAGNADNGKSLAEGVFGCAACHILSTVGPAWMPAAGTPGIGARAGARIADPSYGGAAKTAEQYLLESIVDPNVYVVSGFTSGVMPGNFADRVTPQDAADLIAYMLTLK